MGEIQGIIGQTIQKEKNSKKQSLTTYQSLKFHTPLKWDGWNGDEWK